MSFCFVECYHAQFLHFVFTEMGFFGHGRRGVTLAFFGSGCLGRQLRPFFAFAFTEMGFFGHGPGSGRMMTWQENGRFYDAAFTSDTPAESQTRQDTRRRRNLRHERYL